MYAVGMSVAVGHSQPLPGNTVGQTRHWKQSLSVRAVAGIALSGLGVGLTVSFIASTFAAIIASGAVTVVLAIAIVGYPIHHNKSSVAEVSDSAPQTSFFPPVAQPYRDTDNFPLPVKGPLSAYYFHGLRSSGFEQTDPSEPAPVYTDPTMIASKTKVSDSLAEVLQRNGYEIVDVTGDGNCLFRALVLQCPGWDVARLRREMTQEAENWCKEYNNQQTAFSMFTDGLNTYLTVEDEICLGMGFRVLKGTGLQALAKDLAWGDPIVSSFAAKVLRKPIIIIDGKGQIQYAFDDQGNFLEGLAAEGNNLKGIQNISILNNFIVLQHVNNCHFKAIKRS